MKRSASDTVGVLVVTYGLFGDYVLGGAVVQMSAHWFLRLRLEVDGLEVLRHFCV